MPNLRPIVAHCYRGGRSIGNGQSRDFSSLNTKNELPELRAKARALFTGILVCGVSVGSGCFYYHLKSGRNIEIIHTPTQGFKLRSVRAKPKIAQVPNTAKIES